MSLTKQLSVLGFVGMCAVVGFSSQPANAFVQEDLDKLLDTGNCVGCDLSGVDLSDRNFTGTINFVGADLSDADLSDADLFFANLESANLSNANLSGASAIFANLNNANLSNADLSNADLEFTRLNDANLSNADLSNTRLNDTELRNADLSNADLSNANLNNVDLDDANLSNADFSGAEYGNEIQLASAGFLDGITLADGSTPSFCSGLETLTGSSGSFASQSGFGFVQRNSDCDFLIEVAAGNKITLDFDAFNIGGFFTTGTFSIFDGMDETADLLAEFTGGDMASSVMSTGNNLFINFTNNFTPETPGFEVSFSSSAIGDPNTATTPEPSSLLTILALGSLGMMSKGVAAKR